MPATLLSLPPEILMQILSQNVPDKLASRAALGPWMRSHAANRHLLRLAREAFFMTYTQQLDLCCVYTLLSRGSGYTQTHTEGVFAEQDRFCGLVRRVGLRVHLYYPESIPTALHEMQSLLSRYPKLRSIRVAVSTTNWKVIEALRDQIRDELLRVLCPGKKERPVVIFLTTDLMGERISGCSVVPPGG